MFDIGSYIIGKKAAETSAGLTTKSVTFNGTYMAQDDNAAGYSKVAVNVQNGASLTEVQNQYGTELIVASAEGSAPAATRHTLYFEYEDETTETVYAYYDDSLIGSAITATTPVTHNNKTVTSAQLDGVEWYSYTPEPTPSGDWETVFDDEVGLLDETPYNTFWIPSLAEVTVPDGSVWRITLDGAVYTETATQSGGRIYIGNPKYDEGTDNASATPFCFFNVGWGAWVGGAEKSISASTTHPLKIERQVSA